MDETLVHITNKIDTYNDFNSYKDSYNFNSNDKYIFFIFNKLIENDIELYIEKNNTEEVINIVITTNMILNAYSLYGMPICSFGLIHLLEFKEHTGVWNITMIDTANEKIIKEFKITYEIFKAYKKNNIIEQDLSIYKGNNIDILK